MIEEITPEGSSCPVFIQEMPAEQIKADKKENLAIKAQAKAKVAARESALAKLKDLGLTAEEIAAL
jgi:hypothetical protein